MKILPFVIPVLVVGHTRIFAHKHKPSTMQFLKQLYNKQDTDQDTVGNCISLHDAQFGPFLAI